MVSTCIDVTPSSSKGRATTNWCLRPDDSIETFREIGGKKALSLAQLDQLGITIPEWFCVSIRALNSYLNNYELSEQLYTCSDPSEISEVSRDFFLKNPLPEKIEHEILENLNVLGLNKTPTIIRISAQIDDISHNSLYNQVGIDAISLAIRHSWASAYSEHRLCNHFDRGYSPEKIKVAVIIQKMIDAESSGITFSRNPNQAADGDLVSIASVWGIGNSLNQADEFVVSRSNGEIHSKIASKFSKSVRSEISGLSQKEVDENKIDSPSLSKKQIAEVSVLAQALEKQLKHPQRCDWAYTEETLYCLQTKNIPSLPPSKFYSTKVNGIKRSVWSQDLIPTGLKEKTTPLSFSIVQNYFKETITHSLGKLRTCSRGS